MKQETMEIESRKLPVERVDPSVVAASESAKAWIQSAYLMAFHSPRNEDQARDNILTACKRPGFAEKVEYSKPVSGKQIKGPSIRFAELAMRAWGNVLTKTAVIYEDENVRRVAIFCIDLQTNTTHSKEAVINKTVERKKAGEDREIIGERINTKGEKVFIVRATEDELQNKEAAIVSKTIRNDGLRLIPTDIIEEAIEIARITLQNRDAKDPDAAKKKILDSFSEIGVKPKDLEAYLGHKLDSLVPKELNELRSIYRTIKDGEARWADYFEKGEPGEAEKEKPEVNQEAVEKFDQMAIERKVNKDMMFLFLEETAKANQMTIEQIKAAAIEEKEINTFYKRFEKFVQMRGKNK